MAVGLVLGPAPPRSRCLALASKNWGLGEGVVHVWRIHPPSYRS